MSKRFSVCILAMILVLAAAGFGSGKGASAPSGNRQANGDEPLEIVVFAAASLTESFEELGAAFEKRKDGECKVSFNLAGSQALETSVENGAKADVFASASLKYMDMLKEKGFVSDYSIFARNRLVLIENHSSSFSISKLEDLGANGMKIAVGDSSVPVGSYWEKALKEASMSGEITAEQKNAIIGNIKTRELNVKDVLSKVVLGEADIGVVYRTDVTESAAEKAREIGIPDFERFDAEYPVAVLEESGRNTAAREFYEFLFSEEGRSILKKYKFMVD